MSPSFRLAVIGGDGIGPEVTRAALRVLDAAEQRFDFSTVREELRWSSARYVDSVGRITREDIDGLRAFDAILFGAIGDPRAPRGVVERDVILGMRRQLDLYVNLRPIVAYDERLVPLKGKRAEDIDLVVVRENTEDVYTQTGKITGTGKDEVAEVPMRFTRPGIERVVRYAFELARSRPDRHLTLVDKESAPTLHSYTWRDVVLYALGVGARKAELDYLYEGRGPKVLPSFAVVPMFEPMFELVARTGGDPAMVVHGGQTVRIHRPFSPSATRSPRSSRDVVSISRFAKRRMS